jgi:hypothetical protein
MGIWKISKGSKILFVWKFQELQNIFGKQSIIDCNLELSFKLFIGFDVYFNPKRRSKTSSCTCAKCTRKFLASLDSVQIESTANNNQFPRLWLPYPWSLITALSLCKIQTPKPFSEMIVDHCDKLTSFVQDSKTFLGDDCWSLWQTGFLCART